jgi:hypothetical protein
MIAALKLDPGLRRDDGIEGGMTAIVKTVEMGAEP